MRVLASVLVAGIVPVGCIYLAASIPMTRPDHRKQTALQARAVRQAVNTWLIERGTTCPTATELVAAGLLEKEEPDRWGRDLVIQCLKNDVVVTSRGPDRQLGTPDDIRVPGHVE